MPNRAERRAAERAALKANRPVPAPTPNPVHQPAAWPVDSDETTIPAQEPKQAQLPEDESPATASQAQINANRENAQHSTGAKTPEGKATVSHNARKHGLLGRFMLLSFENPTHYHELVDSVHAEFNPQTDTEFRLANSLIQHYWLMQRALLLQEQNVGDDKKLALYMRYQTTHERSYYKAQKELLAFQKQRAQEQIGFESQNQKQEAHEAKVRLTHARAQNLEIDTACRQAMEVPLPGNYRISFEQIAHACSIAISSLVSQQQAQAQAAA